MQFPPNSRLDLGDTLRLLLRHECALILPVTKHHFIYVPWSGKVKIIYNEVKETERGLVVCHMKKN